MDPQFVSSRRQLASIIETGLLAPLSRTRMIDADRWELPLTGQDRSAMGPGTYRLRITVTDTRARKHRTASREFDFEILRGP